MFFGVAFIVVLISLILQGWTVATAARMFDLDVPPAQQASRLDIDLPGRLGDENTVAGYRVEARCRAASRAVETLPLPPTASVLVVIRDGIARSAACGPAARSRTTCSRSHARRIFPCSIACSDHAPSAAGPMSVGCSESSPSTERPHSARSPGEAGFNFWSPQVVRSRRPNDLVSLWRVLRRAALLKMGLRVRIRLPPAASHA